MTVLLCIYCWVRWWKNFENWLTFAKVMDKSRVSCFFHSQGIFFFLFNQSFFRKSLEFRSGCHRSQTEELFVIARARLLHGECPSRHPTNSIKALRDGYCENLIIFCRFPRLLLDRHGPLADLRAEAMWATPLPTSPSPPFPPLLIALPFSFPSLPLIYPSLSVSHPFSSDVVLETKVLVSRRLEDKK